MMYRRDGRHKMKPDDKRKKRTHTHTHAHTHTHTPFVPWYEPQSYNAQWSNRIRKSKTKWNWWKYEPVLSFCLSAERNVRRHPRHTLVDSRAFRVFCGSIRSCSAGDALCKSLRAGRAAQRKHRSQCCSATHNFKTRTCRHSITHTHGSMHTPFKLPKKELQMQQYNW